MSIFDVVAKSATRVVMFPERGLAIQVRAVTAVELALHDCAALIAARGPKSSPELDRKAAAAQQAQERISELRAQRDASAAEVLNGEDPKSDVGKAILRAFWETEAGTALLVEVQAQQRIVTQYKAEMAHQRGEDKTRQDAERQQAMVAAGVIGMGQVVDGEVVEMEDITVSITEETSREEGRVNIRDVSWAVPVVASVVLQLTKGDADARLAPFRQEPGPTVAAVSTGEGSEHGPGDGGGVSP
jgi:hypothetical protein